MNKKKDAASPYNLKLCKASGQFALSNNGTWFLMTSSSGVDEIPIGTRLETLYCFIYMYMHYILYVTNVLKDWFHYGHGRLLFLCGGGGNLKIVNVK